MGEKQENDDDNDDDEEEGNQVDDESIKKKKKENLALGKHYYVFVVQCLTQNGPPVRFIAARYCVANLSHRWLRSKLEYIESSLAVYGFIVCSESFDGASENRSCMTHRTTLTFEDICGNALKITTSDTAAATTIDATTSTGVGISTGVGMEDDQNSSSDTDDVSTGEDTDESTKRRYTENDLPWTMKVAYVHPSMEGVIIVPTGDMPHSLKKMRNAMDLSGKDKSARNLHLNGLPISLKMAHDVYMKTPDANPNSTSTLMLYPKLNMNVFQPTSKTAMRTNDAARAQGKSMMDMLMRYGHLNENAGPTTYDSYIYHCRQTDKWVDALNATWKKGCEPQSYTVRPYPVIV